MKLAPRLSQEAREVPHPLEVPHARRVTFEHQRPVVTLAPEHTITVGRGDVCGLIGLHARTVIVTGLAHSITGVGGRFRLQRGSNVLEAEPGNVKLQPRALQVAIAGIRASEHRASKCGLVGSANLVPQVHSMLGVALCAQRFAFSQCDPCPGEGRAGGQRLTLKHLGDPGELVCRVACGDKVAGGDVDLDLRLQ